MILSLTENQKKRKMNTSVSLILSIFLGIVCTVTALKEGDCEGKYFLAFIRRFIQILL